MVDFWLRARKFWVICSGPNNRLGLGVVRSVISRMTRSSKSRQIAWIILIARTSCVGSLWCNWVVVVQPFRSGITAPDPTGAIRVIYERHLAHVHLTAWSRTSWWRRPKSYNTWQAHSLGPAHVTFFVTILSDTYVTSPEERLWSMPSTCLLVQQVKRLYIKERSNPSKVSRFE